MICLQALDLSYNSLSGSIPVSLAGCFQLWQLKRDYNNLSDTLRPELDAFDSLKILNVAGNRRMQVVGDCRLELE